MLSFTVTKLASPFALLSLPGDARSSRTNSPFRLYHSREGERPVIGRAEARMTLRLTAMNAGIAVWHSRAGAQRVRRRLASRGRFSRRPCGGAEP